jgi:hypothetical protein
MERIKMLMLTNMYSYRRIEEYHGVKKEDFGNREDITKIKILLDVTPRYLVDRD